MDKNQFKLLVYKYLDGNISEEEKNELFHVYRAYQNKELEWNPELMGERDAVGKRLLGSINNRIDSLEKVKGKKAKRYDASFFRYAAAAMILLFLSIGVYFLLHKEPAKTFAKNIPHDVSPGGNKAILTLSGGQQIILSDTKNGQIATQGKTTIKKTADGQIEYYREDTQQPNTVLAYNTIATPRGGQFWVTLPDGSKVFLNSASSLKYPVDFNGKERKVELTGEAYFEVVHNSTQPFSVIAAGQTIEDIGTHFNINAYNDEPFISTTLSEGRIRISNANGEAYLVPGQQAQASKMDKDSKIKITIVDVEDALAWKSGRFVFENENIHSIMRKLARWYDIEPEYSSNVSEIGFGGSVSRNKNISEVLKVLEVTQAVHFKIEGRRIKVMP